MKETENEYIEEEESGLSFGDICHRIWHARIALAVTTVITFTVCALGIQYLYTRQKKVYTGNIQLNFLNAEDGKYPLSSSFYISDIPSLKNLETVKASSDKYSSLDVEKMSTEGGIVVTPNTVTSYSQTGTTITTTSKNYFNISVTAKYFSDIAQARSFISDLCSIPVNAAMEQYSSLSFDDNLNNSKADDITYTNQISYLQAQYDYLISSYDILINDYSNQYVTVESDSVTASKSISQYKNDLVQYFADTKSISTLQDDVNNNGYVKNIELTKREIQSLITNLKNSVTNLIDQRDLLKKQFSDMYGGATTSIDSSNSMVAKISELTTQIGKMIGSGTIDNPSVGSQLYYYNKQLENANNNIAPSADFTSRLETYTTKLTSFTDTYSKVVLSIYKFTTNITYDLVGTVVKTDGGISTGLNLVISLVAGLLVGCLVSGVKGNSDIKHEEEVKAKAEPKTAK